MGNSRDIERANQHKKLFEKMLAKVDHKKDAKGRNKEAQDMMTKKLGPQWRDECEVDGTMYVSIEAPDQERAQEKMDQYYDRVNDLSDTEGLQAGPDAPDVSKEQAIESMLDRLKKILMGAL